MLLVLVQTFLGLAFLGLGTYLAFIYLQSLADGPAMWAILYASLLIVSGIVLLLKAGASEVMVVKKIKMPQWGESSEEGAGLKKQLEQNNKMAKEWDTVNETKDKLRMLSVADTPDDKGKTS